MGKNNYGLLKYSRLKKLVKRLKTNFSFIDVKFYVSSTGTTTNWFHKALQGCFIRVRFRKSLVDAAPRCLCHDVVASSQQLDQAKQVSGYAYNFLSLQCPLQYMGHAKCSYCLCVCAFLWEDCSVWQSASKTSLYYTDWQQNQQLLGFSLKAQVDHDQGRVHTDSHTVP